MDVFGADERFGERSRATLHRCVTEGGLVACEVVFAEIAAAFPTSEQALAALAALGVGFSPLDPSAALAAGGSWRDYRKHGGRRERVVADFLIAAHAAGHADRLLTRDRGFYRRYFPTVQVLDPGA